MKPQHHWNNYRRQCSSPIRAPYQSYFWVNLGTGALDSYTFCLN